MATERNIAPQYYPFFNTDDKDAVQLINQCSECFGGINFRSFSKTQSILGLFEILMQPSKLIVFFVFLFVIQLRLVQNHRAIQLLITWLLWHTQIDYLSIISHHFMNKEQIETCLGQERINACVFRVPINGSLILLCEVNALSYHEEYYQTIDKSI